MRSRPSLVALAFAALQTAGFGAEPDLPSSVGSVLKAHCSGCHGGAKPKGDLDLQTLGADFSKGGEAWKGVLERLIDGSMPPEGKRRPTPVERKSVTDWVAAGLSGHQSKKTRAEGRSAVRRLNRVEYGNTLRDLLGIEVDLSESLPEDGSAHGFDTVGEGLTLSPVLMDRYLAAADTALDAAIVHGPRPTVQIARVPLAPVIKSPTDYRLKSGIRLFPDNTIVLFNSGYIPILLDRFKAPLTGHYRFRLSASAFQSRGKPLTLSVHAGSFDPKLPRVHLAGHFDVPPNRPLTIEFTASLPQRGTIKVVPFRLGQHDVPDPTKYEGPGIAVHWVEIEGPLHEAWPPLGHARLLGAVDLAKGTAADAAEVLRDFVPRAFRRPVGEEAVRPFVRLAETRLAAGYPFEDALRVGLKAVLCAPEFLLLMEHPGRLDGYALASRLSYFLWSTAPDDALLSAAATGKLGDSVVLREWVERMLKDPKAAAFTENFTGQWLDLRKIDSTTPDRKLYPEFDDLLLDSMTKETHLFFDDVLARDLPVSTFVDSDFAVLNARLAAHYGIPGVVGQAFRRVALPPGSRRGGVLTHASVLKVTANGTNTSPVIRGAWVLDKVLGTPAPPPPKNVPAIEPDIRGAKTIREQLEKHRNVAACASCHAKIDPPGFALEEYDVIGGWRENYRVTPDFKTKPMPFEKSTAVVDGRRVQYAIGPKVDSAGQMADGRKFAGLDDFKRILLADPDRLAAAMAEKLLVYATGHGGDYADRAAIEAIVRKTKDGHHGLRTLVHAVTQSETFRNK